jgi:two-component system, OmpR family, manganese sensing response regulator
VAKILVADDDLAFADGLKDMLMADKHTVDAAYSGEEAEGYMRAFDYELLVLDWEMPEPNGIEICRRYRARGGMTPILMLTGKSSIDEKETGLEAGADDYVTKPFNGRELKARVKALLRRPSSWVPEKLADAELELDPAKRALIKSGTLIDLQPLEYALLEFFLRHPDRVFSPDELQRKVWDSDEAVSTQAIYAAIRRLRSKIDTPDRPSKIHNVHGHGYKFTRQSS